MMYDARPLRLQPLNLVFVWRRRKVDKIRKLEQRIKDMRYDLGKYDAEMRRRGYTVRTCDDCDNLNFKCEECATISCQSYCRKCTKETTRVLPL